jgi:hypothetical protein
MRMLQFSCTLGYERESNVKIQYAVYKPHAEKVYGEFENSITATMLHFGTENMCLASLRVCPFIPEEISPERALDTVEGQICYSYQESNLKFPSLMPVAIPTEISQILCYGRVTTARLKNVSRDITKTMYVTVELCLYIYIYRDLDSNWKLRLFASLITTTNYNKFHRYHYLVHSQGTLSLLASGDGLPSNLPFNATYAPSLGFHWLLFDLLVHRTLLEQEHLK